MPKLLALAVLSFSSLASAQTETEKTIEPPAPGVVAPTLPDWGVGAGFGVLTGSLGLSSSVGVVGGLTTSVPATVYIAPQPQLTLLIERRLGERLFLTFQALASYGLTQDDTNRELKGHHLNLQGALGLRKVFNPRGVIEVSWFGNAGFGYTNDEIRAFLSSYDPATAKLATTLQILRSHTFSIGAFTGLALERELITGLALRLASSILGVSYGLGASTTTTPANKVDQRNHLVELGLRFSPSVELRYAF